MEGHAALLRRVEQLTGKLPIVAISGHTESRGCTEPCSQEIIDAVSPKVEKASLAPTTPPQQSTTETPQGQRDLTKPEQMVYYMEGTIDVD